MNILTDLVNAIVSGLVFRPTNINANSTWVGSLVDFRLGSSRFQEFAVIQAGTITDGSYEIKLVESNEMFANFTDVTNGIVSLTSANSNSNTIFPFYRTKRYLKAFITSSGLTGGGYFAVLCLAQQHRPGATALVP